MARKDHGPSSEVAPPPCDLGVSAVDAWAQRARMAVDGPRAEVVGRCLDLLAGTSRAAQDSEAVLRLQDSEGGGSPALVIALGGGEAPEEPVALALWQWCEAARQCHLAAAGPVYVVDAACAEVRRLCRAVRARPLAAYEEAQRRFRSRDLRGVARDRDEVEARLAEEKMDDEVVEAARSGLLTFATYMKKHFKAAPHLELVCAALERVERGECKRLIINMPPQHGKTEIVSRLFPAWYFGRNPSRAVLFATHTATYAEKIGRNVRNNIGSAEFQRVFPDVSLAEDSKAASAFEIVPGDGFRVKRGQWAAYGMGGSYTGSTAELLIFDDLLTEQDSNSEAALETAYESIEALYSRLADKTGAWVVVNTRYNLRDVVAYLTREYAGEGWEILSLPAIAEAEEEFKLPSGKTWHRHVGDALFPDRFSIERLTAIMNQRLQTNAPSWWGQYQCRPVPADGNIVKWSWFDSRRYHDSPAILALGCTRVVVSVDTSKGASDKAARTAISVWGEHAGRTFLLDSWAKAIPYTEQRQRLKDTCGRWRPQVMLIEDKSTGEALIDDLRKSTDWVRTPIVGVKPRGSKEERMQAVTPQMADGQVWIPRDGHPECRWLQAFAEEMSLYPKGVFRDQGDTVSQYLRWRDDNSIGRLGGFSQENVDAAKETFKGSWGRAGSSWGRPR